MAPEQGRGEAVDYRADISALGVTLYEMLARQQAFRKPTSAETMAAILHEDPPAISGSGPGLSPELHRIVHRCLEKSRNSAFNPRPI